MEKAPEYSEVIREYGHPEGDPPSYSSTLPNAEQTQYSNSASYSQYAGNSQFSDSSKNTNYNINVTYVRTRPVQPPLSSFELKQKNKPQSNAIGAVSLIFLSGGMNLAYSFTSCAESTHLRICWCAAAIIGALMGAHFTNRVHRKFMIIIASILVISGGIFFSTLSRTPAALIVARYMDGFANGLVIVPGLAAVGELSVKNMRGILAGTIEAMCFSLGTYMAFIYAITWGNDLSAVFNLNQMFGVLSIFYGALALLFAFVLVMETPVYYLLRNDEMTALDCLRRLQQPFIFTTETYEQFEEHKRYIAKNKEMTFPQAAKAGLPALLKLCVYRGMVALGFSIFTYAALIMSASVSVGTLVWPVIVMGTLRWVTILISTVMLDNVGRKPISMFGMIMSGPFAIAIGVVFIKMSQQSDMMAAMWLLFVNQFFASIAVPPSSAYLSEAFPLAVKPYYIAISFSVEMIVHVISLTCALDNRSLGIYFCTVGGMSVIVFIGFIYLLPETTKLTLREAQEKFRKFISLQPVQFPQH